MAEGTLVGRGYISVYADGTEVPGDIRKIVRLAERNRIEIPARLDMERILDDIKRLQALMPRLKVPARLGMEGIRDDIKRLQAMMPDLKAEVDLDYDRDALERALASAGRARVPVDLDYDRDFLERAIAEGANAKAKVKFDADLVSLRAAVREAQVWAGQQSVKVRLEINRIQRAVRDAVREANVQADALPKVKLKAEIGGVDDDNLASRLRTFARRATIAARQHPIEFPARLQALNETRLKAMVRQASRDVRRHPVQLRATLKNDAATMAVAVRRAVVHARRIARDTPVVLYYGSNLDSFKADLVRAVREARTFMRANPVPVYLTVEWQDIVESVQGASTRASMIREAAEKALKVRMPAVDLTRFAVSLTGAVALAKAARATVQGALKTTMKGGLTIPLKVVGVTAAVGSIATIGTSVLGVLPSVVALGGAISTAVASLAPLGALLPAMAASLGAVFGTLKAAFSGFGEALDDSDPEKWAEALSKLPPQARNAARSLVELKNGFDPFKTIQNTFFHSLAPLIGGLAARTIPVLRTQMQGLAAELNLAARELLTWAQSDTAIATINALFGATRQAVANLRPALQPFLDGLAAMIRVGAGFLPNMAAGITRIAEAFKGWAVGAEATGSLREGILNAIQVLGQMWSVLGSVWTILSNIFGAIAAANGGLIGGFAAGLERIAQVTGGPAFQQGLTGFFAGAQAGFMGLMQVLPGLGAMLAALGPVLGNLAAVIGPVIGQILGALAMAIAQVAPALTPLIEQIGAALVPLVGALGQAFAALVPILVTIAEALAGALGIAIAGLIQALPAFVSLFGAVGQVMVGLLPVFQTLVGVVVSLLPYVVQIAQALGPALVQILTAAANAIRVLAPVVGTLAVALAQGLAVAVETLVPMMMDLHQTLGRALLEAVRAVAPLIPGLAKAFLGLVQQVVPLIAPLVRMAADLLPALTPLFMAVAEVVLSLARGGLTILLSAFKAIMPVLGSLLRAVLPVLTDLFRNLAPVIDALAPIVGDLLIVFGEVLGDVLKPLLPLLVKMIQDLLPPVARLLIAVVTAAKPLIEIGLRLIGAVFEVLIRVIGVLIENILPVLVSLIENCAKVFEALGPWLEKAADWIGGALTDAMKGAREWFGKVSEAAEEMGERIADGLSKVVDTVMDWISDLGGLPDGIKRVFSDAGNWLRDAGRNIIQGLVKGISGQSNAISDSLLGGMKNAVDGLKRFLGIHSPSRLMAWMGGHTGGGLILGIRSKAGQVAAATRGLAEQAMKGFGTVDLGAQVKTRIAGLSGLMAQQAKAMGQVRALGASRASVAGGGVMPSAAVGPVNRSMAWTQNVTINNPSQSTSGYSVNQAMRLIGRPGVVARGVVPV